MILGAVTTITTIKVGDDLTTITRLGFNDIRT